MRFSAFLPSALLLGTLGALGCRDRSTGLAPVTEPRPKGEPVRGLRPQPKPGERVVQPELDGYCTASRREAAYYYHGGSPVVRIAREDGCTPLYITECEAEGRCYPPRDQEPGMWCCAAEDQQQTAARAAR
jgi:hypothetical protein